MSKSSIGSPRERAEIRVLPGGKVEVVIGTQPAGQGHETSFSQVISDLLAVPVECVRIVMGDTRIVSAGGGSHSGRSMRHAATVFARAADALIAKGSRIAAIVLGADAGDVAFADGRFGAPASNRSFDFLELAEAAQHVSLPADLADGLAVIADNEMHDPVFPNGAAACEIELDPDTGALALTRYAAADDVGRCINPLIVDGQTHGAIAQGLGQILMENCALDRASGQPLAGSLMDYALPRADVLPSFRTEIVEVLSPTNPLGIKAGGEGGTTPSLAAVTAALLDALRPLGVSDIPIPATPLALWQDDAARAALALGDLRDLIVGREAAQRLLREFELSVDRDLEHAAARAHELDIGLGQLAELRSRTESLGLVASSPAILDDDLHGRRLAHAPALC